MTKNKRFVKIHSQGVMENTCILVDTQTGVNYLWHHDGYAGGLTVLLNRDGTPVISSPSDLLDAEK